MHKSGFVGRPICSVGVSTFCEVCTRFAAYPRERREVIGHMRSKGRDCPEMLPTERTIFYGVRR